MESAPAGAHSEDSALAEARRTGEPVEIADKLTETSAVLANPDGTFTMRSHARPVRAQKNGTWRSVDTTLAARHDGTLAPVASTADIAFSGGGDTPLVTLTEGDKKVSLSWPTPLPSPTVAGNTATYPGVFPGVDLQVIAGVDSFSEVLIVRDAAAARNPALANVKLTAVTSGLVLDAAADGTLSAKDAAGKTVFAGSTPIMWDSGHDVRIGPAPTAADPGGARVTAMKVIAVPVNAGKQAAQPTVDITIKPDPARLTGPDVTYPVYIDPSMSQPKQAWTEVTSTGWHYFNHPTMDAQVGNCGNWPDCDGNWVARSFFRMPTQPIMSRNNGVKAHLFDASFFAYQTHGTSCTAEAVDLYQTGSINEHTRWAGPTGTAIDRQFSNAGSGCNPPGWVRFNAWTGVRNVIDHNWPDLTLGLLAPDEANKYQWKKFTTNPHLDVVFSFPPNVANEPSVSNAVTCSGTAVTPDAHPTLYARATDNNEPPLNLNLFYKVWAGSTVKAESPRVEIASGSQGTWPSNVNLGDGYYTFEVAVQNIFPGDPSKNIWAGPWSAPYGFITRSLPITHVPTVTSTDYPPNYWGRPQNMPGRFTVNANGAANIKGFTYTFNGAGTESVPKTTDCNYNQTFGTNGGWVAASNDAASITIPAGLSPGHHTLHVRSFDDAHKLSPESQKYTFYVAPTVTPAPPTVKFEGESLPRDADPGMTLTESNLASASGGKFLQASTRQEGESFTVTLAVPVEGDYQVTAFMLGATSVYGGLEARLNDKWIAGKASGSLSFPLLRPFEYRLTGTHLTAGEHQLSFFLSKNPGTTSDVIYAALDYIQLAPTVKLDVDTMPIVAANQGLWPVSDCCGVAWNNGGEAEFQGSAVDDSFSVQFTAPVEADYALSAVLTKAPDYGIYTVSVDNVPLGRTDVTPFDAYHPTATTTHLLLGGAHLTAGAHTFTIKLRGTNPNSIGGRYLVGIDYITAQPINNVTAASLTDAMNNKGISADNTTAATFDLNGTSLSAQTLTAAGLSPGSVVTISGATFTMPAKNTTTGNDNVIAAGQTIPLPAGQQIKANAVGLLVASTCGTAPPTTGTITYTDGTTSNPLYPSVADWATGPTDSAAFVLPYRNEGTVPQPAAQPRIYAIFPPANPAKTVKSVTFPNYGTSFLDSCPQAAVHVLAMAPRPVGAGWIGTWTAPADSVVAPPGPGFTASTVRTIVRPTVTGGSARIRLSNLNNTVPITVGAASIAAQTGTAAATTAPVTLKFSGSTTVTVPAGGEAYSDPVPAPSGGTGNMTVSLYLSGTVSRVPVHTAATTPTYLAPGNATGDTSGTPFSTTLPGTYLLAAVDVSTTDSGKGTVVVLGDHVTATGAAGSPYRPTWVDALPPKLEAGGTPVPGGLTNASLAGTPATGAWRLNDGTGNTARDSAGTAHASLIGGVTWSNDRGGCAVFDGRTGMLTTAGPVLNTTASYTVSAWVKLNSTSTYSTAVSQGGPNSASFYLQYSAAFNTWAFISPSDKTGSPAGYAAARASTPPALDWTHLAGVFDATSKTMHLYVNGDLAGTATNLTAWTEPGSLAIGGVKRTTGLLDNFFNGSIADVRAYQRAATADDIRVVKGSGGYGPQPGLGAPTAASAIGNLYRTTTNAPNFRTVVVALGSTDILAGRTASAIRNDLTALIGRDSATGLTRSFRPNGLLVHAILTTVPPLGLDPSDPREQQRRQLNADIVTNFRDYGANEMVDFDQAVRDPANANRLAPELLTDGARNSAYHDKIAHALAIAATTFPPWAQL